MADQSSYSVEERILMSVWAHERPHTGKTIAVIQNEFEARFHKEAPPKVTILRWERKLFETGSIKDRERSGRPSTRQIQCAEVPESVIRSPNKSLRKIASELGIPEATMRKHLKDDLGLKTYQPSFVNELSDDDLLGRCECCQHLLQVFNTVSKRGKVIYEN